jgi:hypothetical protein
MSGDAGRGTDAGGPAPDDDAGGVGGGISGSLRTFAMDVHQASARAAKTFASAGCGMALVPIEASSTMDPLAYARTLVGRALAAPPASLQADVQPCGDASHAACANIFENDLAHYGGTTSMELLPLAQQLDATTTDEQLVIFSVDQNQMHNLAVVLFGVRDGWLTGIVFLGGLQSCS